MSFSFEALVFRFSISQHLKACVHFLSIFDHYALFPLYVFKSFPSSFVIRYILKLKAVWGGGKKRGNVFIIFFTVKLPGWVRGTYSYPKADVQITSKLHQAQCE